MINLRIHLGVRVGRSEHISMDHMCVEHGLIPGPPHPPAKVVQHHDVGIHVVQVVTVGWVLLTGPEVWTGTLV